MTVFDETPMSVSDTKEDPKLRGSLNTFKLLFAVLAFNGPIVAVVSFLPLVVAFGNGVGAPSSFVACGVLVALFASGFMKMSKHIDNPGGFYSFVTKGLGRELGLGAAFLATVSYGFLYVAGYSLLGNYLQSLVRDTFHGPNIPWQVLAVLVLVVVSVFGYFNVEFSARTLTVCMVLEGLMIVAYDAAVIGRGGANGLSAHSFTAHNIFSGNVGLGLLFAMLCLSGFEVTVIFRDEVKDPDRTISRATYWFIALIGIGYALSMWAFVQAVGEADAVAQSQIDPTGTSLGTFRAFTGAVSTDLVTVLVCTGTFASMLGLHNVLSRYVFNLGVDGVFSRRLGVVHHRHGSPHLGSFVVSTVAAVATLIMILVDTNPKTVYAPLSGGSGYGFILSLSITTVAIIVFMNRQRPANTTMWHRIVAPSLALVGLGGVLVMATKNIGVLVGDSAGVVTVMLTLLYGALAAGIVWARVLKRTRPQAYAKIGRQ
ncbi:APC family permease [Nocardia africana]